MNTETSAPLKYSIFTGVKDTLPKEKEQDWQEFARSLAVPTVLADREKAKLFVPATFTGKRSSANVDQVYMAVLDMDAGHSPDDFITDWESRKLAFAIYTTWKHTPESPRWRAVFPLLTPVSKDDWENVWLGFAEDIGHGLSDPACKDASRMYFLPCCHTDTTSFAADYYDGTFLDPTIYIERAPEREFVQQQETSARSQGKVGDVFEEQVSIDSILCPAGWLLTGKSGQMQEWTRPGKDKREGHSATFGYRSGVGGDRLYIFSSSVTNLPVNKPLTKFACYAYLNHGGDFKAAVKQLIADGYGQLRIVEGKSERETGVSVGAVVDFGAKARECTDMMNGVRLWEMFGDSFRYLVEPKAFSAWDGSRWSISDLGEKAVREFAKESAKAFQSSAYDNTDEEQAKKRFAWSIKSMNTDKVNNTMKEAASMASVSILDFDRHPWLLNCKNGIVDLKTGKLAAHDRNLLMSQVTGCEFSTADKDPEVFMKFMAKIMPDKDTRKFLYRFLGYSLTGVTNEQSYVFFHGSSGNNGKSTLVSILQYIFGDYSLTLDTQVVMQTKGFTTNPEYELSRLRGKRFAAVNEVSDSQKLNEPLIKQLTGGDLVRGRQIFGKPFEFPAIAKIYMTGNNKPAIYGQDNAIWRRVNLVPFEVEVLKEERDVYLLDKLREEAPSILRFLVKWCLDWQQNGLVPSQIMVDSKSEYKEENDFIATFIEEETMTGDNCRIGCTKLHQHYLEWARKNGCHAMTPNSFGRVMAARLEPLGVTRIKTGGLKYWVGIDEVIS